MTKIQKIKNFLPIAIIFLLPIYMLRFTVFGIPTTALEILIYVTFAITIFRPYTTSEVRRRRNTTSEVIAFPFLFSAIIGIIISPDKITAFGQFKGFIFDPLLYIYILYANGFLADKAKQQKLFNAYILSAMLISLHAIYQKISGITTIDNRVLGIFALEPYASPNFLAYYIAPACALALNSKLEYRNSKQIPNSKYQITKLLFLFIIFTALVFAQSRGAILAVLASSLIALWIWAIRRFSDRKKIVNLIFIIFSCYLILTTYYLFKPDLSAIQGAGRVTTSSNIRYMIWQTSGKILIENPKNFMFGIGLGNFQNYFTDFTASWANYPEYISPVAVTPHNIFLSMWLQGGLLMLAAFMYLIFIAIKNGFYNRNYLALFGLLTLLFIGTVDTPYWKNDWVIIFWTLLSMNIFSHKLTVKHD